MSASTTFRGTSHSMSDPTKDRPPSIPLSISLWPSPLALVSSRRIGAVPVLSLSLSFHACGLQPQSTLFLILILIASLSHSLSLFTTVLSLSFSFVPSLSLSLSDRKAINIEALNCRLMVICVADGLAQSDEDRVRLVLAVATVFFAFLLPRAGKRELRWRLGMG